MASTLPLRGYRTGRYAWPSFLFTIVSTCLELTCRHAECICSHTDVVLKLKQAILMEIFGTALLTYVVFGVAIDGKATPLVTHMAPLAIGFTVFLAHMMLVWEISPHLIR